MYRKFRCVIIAAVFVFLSSMTALAAEDINGTWVARTGFLTVTMVFKMDGSSVTGTVKTRPVDETEIKDGKIKGDKISFYIMRKENNKNVKVRFEGTIAGDEITFTRDANGTLTQLIAKRSRPNSTIIM